MSDSSGTEAMDWKRRAAAQHFMVNTSAYDNLGQFRLGMTGVNPVG